VDLAGAVRRFFAGPELPVDARSTYRLHLSYVILDAATAGILANAPIMATKGLGCEDWQLSLPLILSAGGLFFAPFSGGLMARRRKLPFVVGPGLAFALCSLAMGAVSTPLPFLLLLGFGALFEVSLRPAVTAVIRANYPASCRGAATGEARKWASLVFLLSSLLSAQLLERQLLAESTMIRLQVVTAGLLSVVSFLLFGRIRVQKEPSPDEARTADGMGATVRRAATILGRDQRFRQYLYSAFFYAFGALVYVAYVPALLVKDLHLGYLPTALLTHIVPSLLAFITTGAWGRWFDRTNVWRAWSWIRTGWGLDPVLLGLAPFVAMASPLGALALATAGRLSRGSVMGGSWVLWWQIGVTHFAPPGGDTTRFLGIILFLNGLTRALAPAFGAWLLGYTSRAGTLLVGGVIVLGAAAHAAWRARRERRDPTLATIASFEAQYPDAQYPDAQYPDAQYPDAQYSDEGEPGEAGHPAASSEDSGSPDSR